MKNNRRQSVKFQSLERWIVIHRTDQNDVPSVEIVLLRLLERRQVQTPTVAHTGHRRAHRRCSTALRVTLSSLTFRANAPVLSACDSLASKGFLRPRTFLRQY